MIDTIFYIADTPGPAILSLPSCSRLRIVHLNWSVHYRKHGQSIKLPKEKGQDKQDMMNIKAINSRDDLIKAYPDQFKWIGKFPGMYHIYLKKDATPVVHTPWKCRQEAGPAIGAGGHCPSDRTNPVADGGAKGAMAPIL